MQSRRARVGAISILGVLIGTAACSGPAASTSAPPASAAQTATESPASSSAAASSGHVVLGITIYPASDPAVVLLVNAAKAEGTKLGVDVKFAFAKDATEQQTAVDTLLAQGVNVLAIDPNDSTAIGTSVKQANTAKVPVIMIIGSAVSGTVATTIASDELLGGQKMGDYIFNTYMHGSGNVAFIQGDETHSAFIDRGKGFEASLAKNPGVKLVARGTGGGGDPTVANTVAADMITKNPDLKAIFGDDDPMAAGIFSAVQAAGKTSQIGVFGYNGNCPTLQGIWNGSGLTATLYQGWAGFGVLTVDTAVKIVNQQQVPSTITTNAYVIDKAAMTQVQSGSYSANDPSLTTSVTDAIAGNCPAT